MYFHRNRINKEARRTEKYLLNYVLLRLKNPKVFAI